MNARDNRLGAVLMTASMAGFAIEDAFLKTAAQALPVGQVTAFMGVVGAAVFALLALAAGDVPLPARALSRVMAVRSGFEIAGRLFYALAIALTPLTTTSAILQATPNVVVMGAALVFGEKVSPGRWALIALGFVGVLVILRPTAFEPLSLLAVLGMAGFAGRDLATRAAPLSLSNHQLGVLGFGVLAASGGVLMLFGQGPVWPLPGGAGTLGALAGATGFGVLGYALLTAAMRKGEIGAVAPFGYARLIFAMVLGIWIFGETPDSATLAGSALIVGVGVVILGQSRRAKAGLSGAKSGANR